MGYPHSWRLISWKILAIKWMMTGDSPVSGNSFGDFQKWEYQIIHFKKDVSIYPLVNVCMSMENQHAIMGKLTVSMAMASIAIYKLPEGNQISFMPIDFGQSTNC